MMRCPVLAVAEWAYRAWWLAMIGLPLMAAGAVLKAADLNLPVPEEWKLEA
jgi:hypothetical protein